MVEDDPVVSRLVQRSLREAGYNVMVSANLESARRIFVSLNPALVLCDVNLPDGSGLDFLRELRDTDARVFTPAIVISARESTADILAGLEVADEYLCKPVDLMELRARIRSAMRIKRLHAELEGLNRELALRVEGQTAALRETLQRLTAEVDSRRKSEAAVRQLTHRLRSNLEEERRRFAGEIHDALGTSLLTLKLLVQSLIADLDPDGRKAESEAEILELADRLTEEIRRIAHALAPVG